MRCFSCNGIGHRASQCPAGSGGPGYGSRNGFGGFGSARNRGCFNCGEEGHQSRDCTKPKQERPRGCYNCGQEGHRQADCPQGSGGGVGGGYNNSQSCFKCGQFGHMSWNCDVEGGGYSSRNKSCYKCREVGHIAVNCPNPDSSSGEICYKCGSNEHKVANCPKFDPNNTDDLPYAKCYLCQKEGHMARNCSDNKNGVYPKGGSGCHGCGSMDHFVRDCPSRAGTGTNSSNAAVVAAGNGDGGDVSN